MEIRCIIIDDEPLAIDRLAEFAGRVKWLSLQKTFDSAIAAISWLKENDTDLIFLDIQMEQLTGIQFLESTKVSSRVIITSAYDEYALKGFELSVTDYLLKPFSFERFLKAVNKVADHYSEVKETRVPDVKTRDYIFIKTEYRLERIDTDSILYVEGMKDYLRIICTDKKIMTLMSFAEMEKILPGQLFCRIHKSFIVSLNKIRSIERGVVLIADQRIPLSSSYRDQFYRKLRIDGN